jgi:hypothetical protein
MQFRQRQAAAWRHDHARLAQSVLWLCCPLLTTIESFVTLAKFELATMAGYNVKGMALLDIQFGMVHESKARNILREAEAQDLAELEQAIEKRKSALHGVA